MATKSNEYTDNCMEVELSPQARKRKKPTTPSDTTDQNGLLDDSSICRNSSKKKQKIAHGVRGGSFEFVIGISPGARRHSGKCKTKKKRLEAQQQQYSSRATGLSAIVEPPQVVDTPMAEEQVVLVDTPMTEEPRDTMLPSTKANSATQVTADPSSSAGASQSTDGSANPSSFSAECDTSPPVMVIPTPSRKDLFGKPPTHSSRFEVATEGETISQAEIQPSREERIDSKPVSLTLGLPMNDSANRYKQKVENESMAQRQLLLEEQKVREDNASKENDFAIHQRVRYFDKDSKEKWHEAYIVKKSDSKHYTIAYTDPYVGVEEVTAPRCCLEHAVWDEKMSWRILPRASRVAAAVPASESAPSALTDAGHPKATNLPNSPTDFKEKQPTTAKHDLDTAVGNQAHDSSEHKENLKHYEIQHALLVSQKEREAKALKQNSFCKHQRARYYDKSEKTWHEAHIVSVHVDDGPDRPYYTIVYKPSDAAKQPVEKQTTRDRLEHAFVAWDETKTLEILSQNNKVTK